MSMVHLVVGWLVESAILLGTLVWAVRRTGVKPLLHITVASFLLRVAVGEALYFVSLWGLPIFRSLQLPGGFWQFAPDGAGFYQAAVTMLAQGNTDGVSEVYVGMGRIQEAIYRVFGTNPSQMLVLNAALASSCAVMAYLAVELITTNSRTALIAAILVAFWPSSILWSGEVLKDPLSWWAIFAILTGSIVLLGNSPSRSWRLNTGLPVLGVIAGSLIAASLRGEYQTPVMLLAITSGIVVELGHRALTSRVGVPRSAFLRAGLLLLAFAMGNFPSFEYTQFQLRSSVSALFAAPHGSVNAPQREIPNAQADAGTASLATQPKPPQEACRVADTLLTIRHNFLQKGGGSVIDATAQFDSCWDMVRYIPRALQLALLEPSLLKPLGEGQNVGSASNLSAIDSLMLWLLAPGFMLGVALIFLKPSGGRVVIAVYSLTLASLMGLSVPNFGTLFRIRLQAVLPALLLAAIGTCALVEVVGSWWRSLGRLALRRYQSRRA